MAIDIKSLTSNVVIDTEYTVSGDGVFDDLMETVTKHVTAQYDAGRITGPEYSTVYLGALQSVLAQATKFIVDNAQVKLLEVQKNELTLNGVEDRLLKETQRIELELNGVKDRELTVAKTTLTEEQRTELELNGVKDRELTTIKTALTATQKEELELNGVKDREYKDKQISMSATQESELSLNGTEDRLLKETQRTELVSNGSVERELKTKQKDLYARQIQGFDENKNQKLFEAQLNSWGLMFSSGMMENVPSIITNDELSKLYCEINNGAWTPPDLTTDPITPGSCSYSAS